MGSVSLKYLLNFSFTHKEKLEKVISQSWENSVIGNTMNMKKMDGKTDKQTLIHRTLYWRAKVGVQEATCLS